MKVQHYGLDESGAVGDENIFFCQIKLDQERENDIFIQNLLNSKQFFLSKNLVAGWDPKKRSKVCHNLITKDFLKARIFRLNASEQNKILYDVFKALGHRFFKIREGMLKAYENISRKKNREATKDTIADIILNLKIFGKQHKIPDFFLKSYAYLFILNKICNSSLTQNYLEKDNQLIRVEIDGGYPFSFWWYNLINNNKYRDLLQNKLFISGITHGDEYYLSVNMAGFMAGTIRQNISLFFDFPINDISYNFQDLNYSKISFSEDYLDNLINPYIKNRILFMGNSKLFEIIPYLFYKKNRSVVYEPFRLRGDDPIKNYFKNFPLKSSKKILIIHSDILKSQEKENLKFCENEGFETKNIFDYKEECKVFFDNIEESSNSYSSSIKGKIQNILEEKKGLLE